MQGQQQHLWSWECLLNHQNRQDWHLLSIMEELYYLWQRHLSALVKRDFYFYLLQAHRPTCPSHHHSLRPQTRSYYSSCQFVSRWVRVLPLLVVSYSCRFDLILRVLQVLLMLSYSDFLLRVLLLKLDWQASIHACVCTVLSTSRAPTSCWLSLDLGRRTPARTTWGKARWGHRFCLALLRLRFHGCISLFCYWFNRSY